METDKKYDRHIFMAYENGGGVPLPLEIRKEVAESVVFDMDRRSIYAQTQEFGYIANTTSEVTVRNAADDNESTLILTVSYGLVSLKEYIPVSFASFGVKMQTTETTPNLITANKLEAGKEVEVTNFSSKFKGTGPATYWWVSNLAGNEITYITNTQLHTDTSKWDTGVNYPNMVPTDISHVITGGGTGNMTASNAFWNKNSNYTARLSAYVADDRMVAKGKNAAYSGVVITWYNHVFIGNVSGNSGSMNCTQIKESITGFDAQGNLTGTNLTTSKYRDILSSNWRVDTNSTAVTCTNGPGTYIYFAVPAALSNSANIGHDKPNRDAVKGVLGGASVQEFSSPVQVSYTNGSGLTTHYDVFVATGQNWTGSTLVLTK